MLERVFIRYVRDVVDTIVVSSHLGIQRDLSDPVPKAPLR